MSDYAELLLLINEELSEVADCQGCCAQYEVYEPNGKCLLMHAADAIEELVAMRNVLKSRLAQLEKAEYESGDCAETYKSGFLVGKRQGAIELLREILGIDVDNPPKEVE